MMRLQKATFHLLNCKHHLKFCDILPAQKGLFGDLQELKIMRARIERDLKDTCHFLVKEIFSVMIPIYVTLSQELLLRTQSMLRMQNLLEMQ